MNSGSILWESLFHKTFFIREKDYRVIRCPDWCFTVLCQVLGEYVWVSRSAAEKPGRPGRHDLRSQHQPEPLPGSRLARETSKAKQSKAKPPPPTIPWGSAAGAVLLVSDQAGEGSPGRSNPTPAIGHPATPDGRILSFPHH